MKAAVTKPLRVFKVRPMMRLFFALGPLLHIVAFATSAPQAYSPDLTRITGSRSSSRQMSFEQNQEQADSQVRFMSRGTGDSISFKENEADFLPSSHPRRHELIDQGRGTFWPTMST